MFLVIASVRRIGYLIMIRKSRERAFSPAQPILLGLLLVSCGAASTPIQPDVTATSGLEWEVELPVTPTYLTVIPTTTGAVLYLEGETDTGLAAWGLRLSPFGGPQGRIQPIASNLHRPFGAVFIDTREYLFTSIISAEDDTVSNLTVITMSHDGAVEVFFECGLPRTEHGQVMWAAGQLLVIYESGAGDLVGFRTSADDPQCIPVDRHTNLLTAPLPVGYSLAWVHDRVVVAGQLADTYSLHIFSAALGLLSTERLATGSATDPRDLSLHADQEQQALIAIYTANEDGSRDVYYASFSGFSAGPPIGRRIVATADPEAAPHLLQRGDRSVVAWRVDQQSTGERLYLAGVVQDDERSLTGGEVLWRHPLRDGGPRASAWVGEGFLRVWSEGARLRISRYRPTFWD